MSSKWLSLEQALEKALNSLSSVNETENVPLFDALGRITAQDSVATHAVPPWDNSAMDGFAVNTGDLTNTTSLVIQSTLTAGMSADEALKSQCAIKIMTGAPIPPNADAVVMIENTSSNGKTVFIEQQPQQGENIRRKACDIQDSQVLVPKQTRLCPEHLMLLSSQGHTHVTVLRKIKVGIVATGTELAAPGDEKRPNQIYESNRVGVYGLVSALGVDIVDYGIVEDNRDSLKALFIKAQREVDVMISSGGVSVGEADYVKDIISELGQIDFWKVAIKPGKPFALGQIGNTVFCGLPGNPVSAYVTCRLLVLPILSQIQGDNKTKHPLSVPATLGKSLSRRPGRRDFQRAVMEQNENGELIVTPLVKQSSGVMTSITSANCLMVIHESLSTLSQGDTIPVIPFDAFSN